MKKINSLVVISMPTFTNTYFLFGLEIIQANCTCLHKTKMKLKQLNDTKDNYIGEYKSGII